MANDYLGRSFSPGRTFTGPTDFNAQVGQWLAVMNTRPGRALGCAPCDRISPDWPSSTINYNTSSKTLTKSPT
ncbi:hypothetical protein ACFWPJ_33505, partial [Nocardia sp. NPDC058497]